MMKNQKLMSLIIVAAALCSTAFAGYWSEPVFLSQLTVPDGNPMSPMVSADGLTMYFDTGMHNTNGLYVATRSDRSEQFSNVQPISELYHGRSSGGPWVSNDGLRLYYAEALSSDYTNSDWVIKMAIRYSTSASWIETDALQEVHAAGSHNANPALTPDELHMFWYSNRGPEGSSTFWTASRASTNDPFSAPVSMSEFDGGSAEGGASLSPDGLTIYFTWNDGVNWDQYMATRSALDQPFGNFQPLVGINSDIFNEHTIHVSDDGTEAYFARLRINGGTEGNGIYYSQYIPEPCTVVLLALGAMAARKRRVW
ncbi:MAG: PD40 domain-containing protein [Sedimentisphaerales bacterium]|nr:PD40 domain-containing protein [Sedimentisphaerales bacterium]